MIASSERMPERGRTRGLRRLRRGLWRLLGWIIIGSAVLVGFGRLLAPYADHARPVLEQVLAERIGQPVRIERLLARWPRLSPVFELEGLSIGPEDEPLLQIERSRLQIRLYNLVRPARNVLELVVVGLKLGLVQEESGRWTWQLDQGGRVGGDWQRALGSGNLVLRDSVIRIDPRGPSRLELGVSEARLRRVGTELQILLAAALVDAPLGRIDARLRLTQGSGGIDSLHAFAIAPLLQPLFPDSGAAASRFLIWFDWTQAGGARLHLRDQIESAPDARQHQPRLTLDGRWQDQRLSLELNAGSTADASSRPIDRLALAHETGRFGLMAEHLDLTFLHVLATPWLAGYFEQWPAKLDGDLDALELGWSADDGLFRFSGRAGGIGFSDRESRLSLEGLELDFELAGDQPVIELGGAVRALISPIYANPIQFERVGGRVELATNSASLAAVRLVHREFDLRIDGEVMRVEQEPFVDLQFDIARLNPDDPRRWLPRIGLGPNTRRWLQQALTGLDEAQADTVLFGKPLSWRRRVPHGALESRVRFRGLTLDYAPNWPIARETRGEVVFLGESLLAEVERTDVAGQVLRAPRVQVRQLRQAELELELESHNGDAASLVELTRSFPLEAARTALEQMRWLGPASASARLWLPVRHLQDWRLVGSVELDGARLLLPLPELEFDAIRGRLPFTRDRFGPAELAVEVGHDPAAIVLDAWLTPQFELQLGGRMKPTGLIPGSWLARVPELESGVRGTSLLSLRIGPASANRDEGLQLELNSDLQGIEIELPEPLRKSAELSWPLRLEIPLDADAVPIHFELEPLGSGLVLGDAESLQLGLGFGRTPARLPNAETFLVEGEIENLDLFGWIDLFGGALQAQGGPGRSAELSGWLKLAVADLALGDTRFGAAELSLEREASYWRAHARGERLEGAVRFPAEPSADPDLVADFEHLSWPAVVAEDPGEPPPPSRVDPTRLPALNLFIRRMLWGELVLGEVRVASHRTDSGLEIEQFSLRGPELEVTGSGRWSQAADGLESSMTWLGLRLNSSNLGKHLRQAGFDLALDRGNSIVEFAGRWPGSPVDFALQRVSGTLAVQIDDGAIPAARPGAGRVLGLVSLNSIPRRLRLDFSDVFGDGLGFDRIAGDFVLTDGLAQTDNLKIDAPAAEIRISGQTDLGLQTYDQQVRVRPGLSATLPIIGALAGGPVGAAAGAALQRILSRPLQGISEAHYRVTGSWDDPQIEPVRDQSSSGDG